MNDKSRFPAALPSSACTAGIGRRKNALAYRLQTVLIARTVLGVYFVPLRFAPLGRITGLTAGMLHDKVHSKSLFWQYGNMVAL
jgi:hypothetical protein